ncbi:hypothetical protein XELAEV_18005225mg [Xenopus laevis]|uniref:HAT C-terminal dimerisation domain-containing protein n=1 Tax=Xenopus laevis TaxID=8355 RepID=A0A974DXQ6_XENLA|nr:hypothetical protein XELAEV_18005225mg [Xenopus laevis]
MQTLYRDLLVRFVKPSIIAGVQDITDINYHDTALHLPANEIMLGFETRNYARRENLIDTSRFKSFVKEAVNFFCKALDYMKKAMPLEDQVLQNLSFLNPNTRLSSTIEELQMLISRFPNIVRSQDMDRLFTEFREYQTSSLPAFQIERIDEFWQKLSLIQDTVTGQPQYRILCKLAKFICLIPHSNATCERLFSTFRKIITDQRSSLGKNPITQQPGPNVYEEATTVRNTLCAILASKINLFNQTVSPVEAFPSPAENAKSATYISLSSRRQPSSSSRSDPPAGASSESVAGPSSEAVTVLGESTSSREPSSAAVRGTSAVSSKDPSISSTSTGSSSEQSTAVVMEPGSSKEPSAAVVMEPGSSKEPSAAVVMEPGSSKGPSAAAATLRQAKGGRAGAQGEVSSVHYFPLLITEFKSRLSCSGIG